MNCSEERPENSAGEAKTDSRSRIEVFEKDKEDVRREFVEAERLMGRVVRLLPYWDRHFGRKTVYCCGCHSYDTEY